MPPQLQQACSAQVQSPTTEVCPPSTFRTGGCCLRNPSHSGVDREKLRAVLLINPTKSTLLPILNRGEVGPKKNQGRPPVSGSTGNQYFFNLLQSNFPASHLALNRLNQTQ